MFQFLGYDVEQWLNVYMDKTEAVDKLTSSDTAIPDEVLLLGALRACPNESSSQQRREAVYRLDGVCLNRFFSLLLYSPLLWIPF